MSIIGSFGTWMETIVGDGNPQLSFRNAAQTDLETWKRTARQRVVETLAMPAIGSAPKVSVHARYQYDGLQVEELSWQLPYGPPTEAIFLKPADHQTDRDEPLPGILALHDHAGNKYFGKRKIARTSAQWHPSLFQTHAPYYGGVSWANEIAKRGYAVLIHDGFSSGSRRVRLRDLPERLRKDVANVDWIDTETAQEPDNTPQIQAYNQWASAHESIMAKSLLAAGTTWAGVMVAEDQLALSILSDHDDVDAERLGCAGLSGGGLRTVFLGGLDDRIRCAICVGQMTTWRDLAQNVGDIHTWMMYAPHLPRLLDYPDVFGIRAPLPTMVQSNLSDPLFSLPEMERADAILHEVFEKAGAGSRYQGRFYPGTHKFDLAMQHDAFDWFDQWLH